MRPDVRPRGVLHEAAARGVYEARRYLPDPAISAHVSYFWLVRWRLDAPYTQHVLTLPACHWVFERDGRARATDSRAVGSRRGRFTRVLSGHGSVFGIAFHPGHARAWLRQPASALVDRATPLGPLLGEALGPVERSILVADDALACAAATRFVQRHLAPVSEKAAWAREVVEAIASSPELVSVSSVGARFDTTERALERLFREHVGVSPKAVIRRFRLVEAARRLDSDARVHLTELAHGLGYFDQAHFIRDFRSIVGMTPSAYRAAVVRR